MMPFLLRALGLPLDAADRLVNASMELRGAESLWWVIPLALALAVASWRLYRRTAAEITPARRWALTVLRAALLWLLLALVLRPTLVCAVEGKVRRRLLCLFDNSASMKIRDLRVEERDLRRAAIGAGILDPRAGLDQPLDPARAGAVRQIARSDLLRSALDNPRLDLLARLRREYDLVPLRFNQTVEEMPAAQAPEPGGGFTALGDALRDALRRERGQPLAGIFLATDGGSNRGGPPLEAADAAAAEGVPLYVYGVGIGSPRDIIVSGLFTPEVAFARDAVNVAVRVRGQNLRGESARLTLQYGDGTVAAQDVAFAGDEEQTVALKFAPQKPGEGLLRASIAPRADEAIKENNAAAQRLRVVDRKIRVLFIEQAPRWEFRYLQALLLRDARLETRCALLEADPVLAQARNSPYLKKLPDTKEELFGYDLVIVGDVDPKAFPAGQMDALNEFVSHFGGAAIFVAGRSYNPQAYRGTPLEKMLPVELSPDAAGQDAAAARPIPLELTPAGRISPLMRLAEKEEDNLARWRELAPVFWTARVARAKPAAETLLSDPDPARVSRGAPMPALALQAYGAGQVLYVGTDNLWRWRRGGGETAYNAFWGQAVGRLTLARLLGGARRTQLSADREAYAVGDRATVFARLCREGFEPRTDPVARGLVALGGGSGKTDVPLRAVPDQPGMYRGEFVASAAGEGAFSVEGDPQTALHFRVEVPQFEPGATALNELLLREMARRSGGRFFREEDLDGLPEAIGRRAERVRSTVEADLWSSPLMFALIFAAAVAEWTLRRRAQLR